MPRGRPRAAKTFRLEQMCIQLLEELSTKKECSQAECVELAIRLLARREGLLRSSPEPQARKAKE